MFAQLAADCCSARGGGTVTWPVKTFMIKQCGMYFGFEQGKMAMTAFVPPGEGQTESKSK